jgi:hypothetical protein
VGGLGVSTGVSTGTAGVGVSTGVSAGNSGLGVGAGVSTGGGLGVGTGVSAGTSGVGGSAGVSGAGAGAGISAASSGLGVGAGTGVSAAAAGAGTGLGGSGSGGPSGLGSGFGGFGASSGGSAGGSSLSGATTTASLPGGAGLSSGPLSGFSAPAIALPASLAPLDVAGLRRVTQHWPDIGAVHGTRRDLNGFRQPLRARPGTPTEVVQRCREAIVAAALPYGVVRADAASAGPMRQAGQGYAAPVEFKMLYRRQGGLETRQATIACRLDMAGRVVAAA